MQEEIITFLRSDPHGATSQEIGSRFLKIKNSDSRLVHAAVSAFLSRDCRCVFKEDGKWYAAAEKMPAGDQKRISSIPWLAVHIISDPNRKKRTILYVSLWEILPKLQCVFSGWVSDTSALPAAEKELLTHTHDTPFNPGVPVFETIAGIINAHLPVYVSSYDFSMLSEQCGGEDVLLTDDYVLIRELAVAAGVSVKNITVNPVDFSGLSGYRQGEKCAENLALLFCDIADKGLETRDEIDKCNEPALQPQFKGKNISYEQITASLERPGIYAFKDDREQYLYIGKAGNLKRRLLTYFRATGESPEKINSLRSKAHTLITHPCGSELESLLLEYRLIKKHKPLLNSCFEITERKGTFTPVNDCIVLLPHSDPGKGMSFWFRRDQKIIMKPFDTDFTTAVELQKELELFFLSDKLPPEKSDFPEQEIVFRWIKKHRDHLVIIPVNRLGSSQEIIEAVQSYWADVQK